MISRGLSRPHTLTASSTASSRPARRVDKDSAVGSRRTGDASRLRRSDVGKVAAGGGSRGFRSARNAAAATARADDRQRGVLDVAAAGRRTRRGGQRRPPAGRARRRRGPPRRAWSWCAEDPCGATRHGRHVPAVAALTAPTRPGVRRQRARRDSPTTRPSSRLLDASRLAPCMPGAGHLARGEQPGTSVRPSTVGDHAAALVMRRPARPGSAARCGSMPAARQDAVTVGNRCAKPAIRARVEVDMVDRRSRMRARRWPRRPRRAGPGRPCGCTPAMTGTPRARRPASRPRPARASVISGRAARATRPGEQHRRVELDELDVGSRDARRQRQRDAVGGGPRGVGAARVELAAAAGREDHRRGVHDAEAPSDARSPARRCCRHRRAAVSRRTCMRRSPVRGGVIERTLHLRAGGVAARVDDAARDCARPRGCSVQLPARPRSKRARSDQCGDRAR